jgi:hypothetical protein
MAKRCGLSRPTNKAFHYPTLIDSLKKLPTEQVVLDGEIVALDEKGRSSFQLLPVFKSSGAVPLVYHVFGLLFLEGETCANTPHRQAKIGDQASYLSADFEFESADVAAPYHAFIVNDVAADDFGHHGQIEVANFRIAFG